MNESRAITVSFSVPPSQEGPLTAALAALKIDERTFVAAVMEFALRKAEEGVFDGSLAAADALEMNSGFARQLRDRIGRMVQVTEKALAEQQAVLGAFRTRVVTHSASHGGRENG